MRNKIRVQRESSRGCDGCWTRGEVRLIAVADMSMRLCNACVRKLVTALDQVAIGADAYEVLA